MNLKKFLEVKYSTLILRPEGKKEVYGQREREEFQAELEEDYFKHKGCKVYILTIAGINLSEKEMELREKRDKKIKEKVGRLLRREQKRMLIEWWFREIMIRARNELLRFGAWLFMGWKI